MEIGLAALLAPALFGVINKTKAIFAGRRGPPALQLYFDVAKLLRKGAVYSRTTSWIFQAAPIAQLACAATALSVLPFGPRPAALSFPGDFILLVGLLGLMRFMTVAAAMDTGSSFEGMGASREVAFSALAEPALLLSLAALARETGSLSLSGMMARLSAGLPHGAGPALALACLALFAIFLAENSRMPVDDPNTHLELTMIHEVMILDHGGPDLAFILCAAALKLWILGALLVETALLGTRTAWEAAGGMLGLAIVVGILESSMARLRLLRVPQLLIGAGTLAALALMLVLRPTHNFAFFKSILERAEAREASRSSACEPSATRAQPKSDLAPSSAGCVVAPRSDSYGYPRLSRLAAGSNLEPKTRSYASVGALEIAKP